MDTKLIIFSGTSGAGKSTTSKALSEQLALNGVRQRWIHEEIKNHPIRDGEFGHGSLDDPNDLQRNIEDMFERWRRLVAEIREQDAVYVMEGVLYENIDRYFFRVDYPDDKIREYFDRLMAIMEPVRPTVIHLCRSDIKTTYEKLFKLRGDWWERAV